MILYHGSDAANIEKLRPAKSGRSESYVYLTHSPVLATIYAHNPLTRPNGFFSYWWRKDGILCYDEYFENQLEEIYSGQRGFLYECEGEYAKMEKMPWVYLSREDVPVKRCTEIPNLYEQLLKYEQEGLLTVQRWGAVSVKQRKIWKNVVKRSLETTDLTSPAGMEYYEYVKVHFPGMEIGKKQTRMKQK